MSLLRALLVLFALFTVLTGVVYPLAVTGIAQVAFSFQANGSLSREGGKTVGSALVGQPFASPRYFWGRPSATSPMPYNGGASSGSNLGPHNPALTQAVAARIAALRAADPDCPAAVPVDLVTASASGLDPHISPASAYFQVGRVGKERGLDSAELRELVRAFVEAPALGGALGEPRVNVLSLNLALDALAAKKQSRQ